MPNEKNKSEEVRSSGKKSVTKRSSTSSQRTGTRSASSSKTASTGGKARSTSTKTTSAKSTEASAKTASAQSKTRQPSGAKPKSTPSGAKTPPKKKSAVNANSKEKTGTRSMSEQVPLQKNGTNGRSRQNTSARDDFRLFSEESLRDAERRRKAEQAKKTASQSARRSSGTPYKKGKSKSRSKLVSVLTYAMMIFAFAALMVTLSLTVFFKIDNIKVTYIGTEYYSEDNIITLSGIEEGENIFSIPADKIEDKIEESMPYIEKCEVERAFPTGINIKVTGAQPAGIVTLQTGLRIVISEEGKTLETLPPEVSGSDAQQAASETDISASDVLQDEYSSSYIDETKLPVIIGLNITEGMEEGKYITVDDETALPILKQLVALLEAYELPPTKIDLSAGNLYSYYDGRIEIKLGSGSQLEAKIKMAHEIILSRLSAYDSGRVDVTNPAKSYFTPEYMLN